MSEPREVDSATPDEVEKLKASARFNETEFLRTVENLHTALNDRDDLARQLADVRAEQDRFHRTLSRIANGQSFHPGSEASNVLKGLT